MHRRVTHAAARAATFRFLVLLVLLFNTLSGPTACRDPNDRASSEARETPRVPEASVPSSLEALSGTLEVVPSTLRSSWPRDGTRALPRSEWIQLEFSAPPAAEWVESFRLTCGEAPIGLEAHAVRPTFYVVNPVGELPAATRCIFDWLEGGVVRDFAFHTARRGSPAEVVYDRDAPGLSPPLPDHDFLRAHPGHATGLGFAFERFGGERPLQHFASMLERDLAELDGWSPLTHLQIALSDAADPASLPLSPAESIHPAAALQWIDMDPRSPGFGERIAFQVERREDAGPDGRMQHSLLLHPLLPLRRGGRYALIATRNLRASPERPFEPSIFTQRVLGRPSVDESPAVRRVRSRLRSTLWVAEHYLSPPIPREDMALIVHHTVGSLEGIGRDLALIRRQLGVRPPARASIDRVEGVNDPGDPLEAIVHGTWHAPRWTRGAHFLRDASGTPVIEDSAPIPFTLALPRERALEGAPIVIYQHGNPGNARSEVPIEARRGLAEAGFAVVGFSDVFNRELSRFRSQAGVAILAQWANGFAALRRGGRVPERWLQTHAEQLAFVRFVQSLGDLDLLPRGRPDGVPDLDVEAPFGYQGVSEGANHAPAFLAFAPEIAAATLIAGGAPITGALTHQIDGTLGGAYATRALGGHGRDLWSALVLLQTALDRQDPLNYAPLLFRETIEVEQTRRKASILLQAGLYDRRIPNRMTDALAWAIGPLPLLEPVKREVPFLSQRRAPIRANLSRDATGAYQQVVPFGVVGAGVGPDCRPRMFGLSYARSGHFCAQLAPSAIAERVAFFLSALEGRTPVIGRSLEDLSQAIDPQRANRSITR